MASINVVAPRNKLSDTRKGFRYDKARFNDISCELRDQFPTFECLAETAGVQDMGSLFKNKILRLT